MEPDAPTHPRFKYFPEAGEDPYHSFLGVPLIESGIVQGVLVVQTVERRPFSPNEIRMLVTVGSQLAPLVSGRGCWSGWPRPTSSARGRLQPTRRSQASRDRSSAAHSPPGTGVGQAYLIGQDGVLGEIDDSRRPTPPSNTSGCTGRWRPPAKEITRLSRRISHLVGEDHGAILQAQLMILQDSTVERDLAGCLAAGSTAESALARTLDKYVATFQKLTNPFFQERIFDIKDVFRRILWHLPPQETAATLGEERLVLVAHEASVLDLFSVDLDHLVGVVVEHGGPHSHAVIIARSLGIPMVGQVPGLIDQVKAGQLLRVDGSTGQVELDPSATSMAMLDGGEPATGS